MTEVKKRKHFSSSQIIIYGFAGLILSGTFLLMLPFSTQQWGGASFLDALFTATSASCVTGLVVQDTATYWSMFGQFVIMMLIQIGGMGVVTVAVAITVISGKKIGLFQRSTMQEAISAQQVGGIVRMTGFILKTSALIELCGVFSFSFVFVPEFGLFKGLWYSLFHSVSAFCNAGFDLMGVKAPFSSLMDYSANGIVNMTVMSLIVIGGIGFSTWADFNEHGINFRRYRMQSKVILTTTALLIGLSALYFFVFEFSSPVWGDMPLAERIWSSFFRAVTPRTAGFNTTDLTLLSDAGQMITIMLMLIGGCPGSTAGGMKTTTLAVLLATAFSIFHKKDSPSLYARRIGDDVIKNAATIFMMYVSLFIIGALIISLKEGLPLLSCMFETASAIGTVGLTQGITTNLSSLSEIVLIALMYRGRVGGLTIIFATVKDAPKIQSKLPLEKITVG